jgi:hypothetical protein
VAVVAGLPSPVLTVACFGAAQLSLTDLDVAVVAADTSGLVLLVLNDKKKKKGKERA